MPTVSNSKRVSRPSKQRSTSKLGESIARGLEQAAAHFRSQANLRTYTYNVPDHVNIRKVRRKIGLSQAEFAAKFALNARTLQEWEQGRATPDLATRAYMTVIERIRPFRSRRRTS